ncbi:serrate RNA effector molecule homolog [Crassostrea angulata]|uniref:serrate RNA effector molecule homolog n=1 Tax=Magallana angulata TaxID=2784310 RepID=UPI0022B15D70|nr:serrate RNA effector molecule homolog [Crassostrea angulata]
MTIDTEPLLRGDQNGDSTSTDKREEENNMKPVKEMVKEIETDEDKRRKYGHNFKTTFNASDSTTDTSKKDENLRRVNKEEREPTSFGRKNSPKDDRKSECNVKDPSDNMEDLNKKNADLNVESLEEGKVILDGGTDSPDDDDDDDDDDDRKLEYSDKDELEEDRLHENDSKVMEMQCMPSNETSAGKNERGSESKSESQKEPEIGEEKNGEEVIDSNTDFKSSSPTSNESKNSTEKEQHLDKKETQNSFKSKIDLFENISQNQ